MKIVVIGAVAAGTSAATKARRNQPQAEVIIYEQGRNVSYSSCGLPYFIGDVIEQIDTLIPRDAAFFKEKHGIDMRLRHQVTAINPAQKYVTVKNLDSGELEQQSYDKLVIATGASAFVPPIDGVDQSHVFSLRTPQDAMAIKNFLEAQQPQSIVIAGTGFIGLELLENMPLEESKVTIVEMQDKITPNLDPDMADYLQVELESRGIIVLTSSQINQIKSSSVCLKDGSSIDAEMVILATGIKPNTAIAKAAGIKLGIKDAIKVDRQMRTSHADIYACGDCIETFSALTGQASYHPLGTTANKTGRICGDAMTGGALSYRGNLGTGIFKLFDLTVATTGLSESAAKQAGFSVVVTELKSRDKSRYFGGESMRIKAVADKSDGRLLGVQIIGKAGVDKRIDVFATLLTYRANVNDLFHLDLAYAPPYNNAKDPVHYTGMLFADKL